LVKVGGKSNGGDSGSHCCIGRVGRVGRDGRVGRGVQVNCIVTYIYSFISIFIYLKGKNN
jgi:hypothetical protein